MSILTPINPWVTPNTHPRINPYVNPYATPLVPSTPNNLGDWQGFMKQNLVAEPISPKFVLKNAIYELAVILPGYLKVDVAITVSGGKLKVTAEKGGLGGTDMYTLTTLLPANGGPISVTLLEGILRVTMPENLPSVINIPIT